MSTTPAPTLTNQQETAQDISFLIIAAGIFIAMIISLMACVMVHKVKSYAMARKLSIQLWRKAFKQEVQAEVKWFEEEDQELEEALSDRTYNYKNKLKRLERVIEEGHLKKISSV